MLGGNRPTDPKPPASEQRHDFGPSFGGDPPQMRMCVRCQKVVGWWEADYRSNETCDPSPAPPEQPARGDGVRLTDGCRLNRDAYQKLIDEDIAWLEKQPRTLEREHIATTLRWSVTVLYGTVEVLDDAPGKDGAK